MENLIKLVRNMHTGEIKLLRHFFRMQQNDDKKRDILFENTIRLKNCKNIKEIEKKVISKLYTDTKNSGRSFEKLKSRLRSDILNILLLQESSVKCESKCEASVYSCKRLVLQSEILLRRGLYKDAVSILEKASGIAQKNELYTEQILIDNICSNYNISKFKKSKNTLYNNQIKKATTLLEKLSFAKQFYEELISYTVFKLGEEPAFENWKTKLDFLRGYSASSDSSQILFYFNICSIYFYRYTKQYDKSLEFAKALLKHNETSEVFKTFSYKGNIHLETARCFLLVKKYDEAIYHSSYASSHFGKDMKNVLSSYEVLFYSFINAENYKDALGVAEKAFSNPYLQKDDFLISKWWFLKAGAEFKMKNYKASIISIKKCNELYKDKNYWMLACSIFETICRIENGDHEWFEYRSEGLRKIMMRHNKGQKNTHNNRFGLIYQILKTLNKNNFDFSRTLAEEKNNIELLAGSNENFSWNLAGCEIVRFDEWIKQKAQQNKSKLVA